MPDAAANPVATEAPVTAYRGLTAGAMRRANTKVLRDV
jgi:hypothetical protein